MMSCCKCETARREIWLDFCAVCGLTQCAECAERGCCGYIPMRSGEGLDEPDLAADAPA